MRPGRPSLRRVALALWRGKPERPSPGGTPPEPLVMGRVARTAATQMLLHLVIVGVQMLGRGLWNNSYGKGATRYCANIKHTSLEQVLRQQTNSSLRNKSSGPGATSFPAALSNALPSLCDKQLQMQKSCYNQLEGMYIYICLVSHFPVPLLLFLPLSIPAPPAPIAHD